MGKIKPNYTKVAVVAHGKCEWIMCNYIKNNLRLKMEIRADKKGEKSIQITSLINFLNGREFKDSKGFVEKNNDIETEGAGKSIKLKNFKFFIIMDTDDCTPEEATAYQNKSMFKNHWLYEYIEPIYNTPNLDTILKRYGILPNVTIKDKDKVRIYSKAFPTDKNYNKTDVDQIKELAEVLSKDRNTNLEEFLEYCVTCVKKYNLKR